jgi:hypothetical protein
MAQKILRAEGAIDRHSQEALVVVVGPPSQVVVVAAAAVLGASLDCRAKTPMRYFLPQPPYPQSATARQSTTPIPSYYFFNKMAV